jgi:hypothetical protein
MFRVDRFARRGTCRNLADRYALKPDPTSGANNERIEPSVTRG